MTIIKTHFHHLAYLQYEMLARKIILYIRTKFRNYEMPLLQRGFIGWKPFFRTYRSTQGITRRCRLSLLTNRVLVIRVQNAGGGGGGVAGSQPMSTAVHIT
jgi:hypothetical protein